MSELMPAHRLLAALLILGCFALADQRQTFAQDSISAADEVLLDEISRAAFLFFIHEADPDSGLVRDKTGVEYCSVASVGFGLAAMPIAAERGWIDSSDAEARTLRVLRTLAHSSAHHHGVFCHYIGSGDRSCPTNTFAPESAEPALTAISIRCAGRLISR